MEDNLETLEQQTAPESTRGLFGPPEPAVRTPPNSRNADKRRSLHQQQQQQQQPRDRSHQRSKSAIISDMSNQSHGRRKSNFGLHTLAEEVDSQKQQDDQSVTVDSLQNMINTLRTLPPYASKEDGDVSPQSSSNATPTNDGKRMSHNIGNSGNRRSSMHGGIDIQSLLPLHHEAKSDRRRSSMMMRGRPSIEEENENEGEEDSFLSREAARAEAEAKLMGTFRNPDASQSSPTSRRQSNRNSMSSDLLRALSRRYSESPSDPTNQGSSRVSVHLPTLPESQETSRTNRRISFNKPLNLGADSNKSTQRSSRNIDHDWRSSISSPVLPYSPRSSTLLNPRHSFNLVPFTPTRVNFSRDDANPHQRRPLFIAHLPFSALTPLFRARQLVRGILRVNKRNRSDAYVFCDELDADIYICGSRDRNRALEGDVVAVRLVDVEKVLREKKEKEEAKLARNNGQVKVRMPDEEDENEIIFGGDDDVDVVKPRYCGVVVAILERAQNQVFSGQVPKPTLTLMRPNNKRALEEKAAEEAQKGAATSQSATSSKEAPRIVWFKATDKRVPLIAIPIEQAPVDFVENSKAYADRLFVGSIKRWPITSLHPFGALERELGSINDLSVQTQAILADNNVTDTEFSDTVLECLPKTPYPLESEDLEERRDMRDIRVFTLEGEPSEVLDNALSIQKIGADTFEVGVHVSDVAHFIKPHSPVDKEARARAIRVELIHKSVPILPKQFTEQVTNLIPDEARFAFSIIWKLNSSGKVLDTWLGKTVIKSSARLTLNDAHQAIDSQKLDSVTDDALAENLVQDIRMLYDITQQMRNTRFAEGAMSEMRQELAFNFDENKVPTGISLSNKDSVSVINDELFLLADKSVAQKISSHFPEQALLRRQGPPNNRKLHELQAYAFKYLGVSIDISGAGSIENAIESIEDPTLRKIISVLLLKIMQPPKFFCTGMLDILKYSHYSLDVPLYTRFTSPSRSFADIIVHRQLECVLTGEKRFYLDRDAVQKIAQHCNVKKEAALYARQQSQMLFLASYLSKRGIRPADAPHIVVVRREAFVVAVFDGFFDVMIPELHLERRIHLANLPVWRSEFDKETRSLTMYWTKGVDTKTGKQRPWNMSDDDEEDDLDEDALLEEMYQGQTSPPATTVAPVNVSLQDRANRRRSFAADAAARSTSKRTSMVLSRLSESTDFSTDLGSQTIQALDRVQVLVTVEMVKTPPLIRVLGANPYA
ncbi:hypothetical protein BX666DRAFT_1852183 [Dichotomocladium elegans]|nr:hypothetical protein BX666DRAFT_1852183 [Dichotomocladium elegans]